MPRFALRRFHRDQAGIAIVEFALILPILILISIVTLDVVRFVIFSRKAELAASTMADLIARNDSGKITQTDLVLISKAQLVIFPEAMKAARSNGQSVWDILDWSLSGIQFKAPAICLGNCTYTPYVAWTAGDGRPCATPLTSAPNTAKPSPTTLPSDAFGTGFLVVADVVFKYTPIIAQSVIGQVNITKSFYVAPRYVSAIAFDRSAGTGTARPCVVP